MSSSSSSSKATWSRKRADRAGAAASRPCAGRGVASRRSARSPRATRGRGARVGASPVERSGRAVRLPGVRAARAPRRAPRARSRRRTEARSGRRRRGPGGPWRARARRGRARRAPGRPRERRGRRRAPVARAAASAARTDRPARDDRARERGAGPRGPGTASTARAWPSPSRPSSTSASTSPGSSSSRSRFETAGRERPTRSATSPSESPNSSSSTAYARASSTGGELLARDVLDEREQERVAVVRLAHERRHGRDARLARGPPAALAGDQLPAAARRAGGRRPAGGRPARGSTRRGRCSPRRRSGGAAGAGSRGSPSTGQLDEGRLRARPPISTSRPRPRPRLRGVRRARQAPSPPSSTRRRPVLRRSYALTGSPWLGASASRTERGTTVRKTSSPKWRRTSFETSAASRVRPSTIVSSTPASVELRVQPRPDELDRAEELREPLERVVLGLHRHEHAVGGGERVHGQRAERGRAVEEDEVVALARVAERVGEVALAVRRGRASSTTAPASSGAGRHELEVRERASAGRAARAGARRAGRRTSVPFARSPSPEVAFACGSRSMTSARSPASARQAARLIAVVVLPTPPFWFASA